MTVDWIPGRDFLLVKQREAEEQTTSGLFIPTEQQKKASEGEVICVGPKVEELVIGDIIKFNRGAGIELGENILLIKEDDYLAKKSKDDSAS